MAGMNLFAAISMALLHRERTGEGSEVGTSLHASGLWSNAILAQGALLGSFVAPRPPRTKPRSALANQYRTSDGRWIQLTIVREDKLWPELCQAIERTDLMEDPRFETTEKRRAHAPTLLRSSIRYLPGVPGPSGRNACGGTRSPSACLASCATFPTTSRPSPTARW